MDAMGIKRINELAALSKKRALTDAETQERDALRKAYLADFKAGFKQTLENTSVKYPNGKIIPLKDANNRND